MSYLIKEIPFEERPRERFKKYGVESLSNQELLSILMRTGTGKKSVMDLSLDILKQIDINDFKDINYNRLKEIKGIGDVKAVTILCAIEFGKRVLSKKDLIYQIKTGDDVYNLVKDEMALELQEKFLVIYLDTRKYVLFKKVLFIGTVNKSEVSPRDIFREAVKNNATYIILVHNHPSGSLDPSYEDIYLTNQFIKLGKVLNVIVLDHIIITKDDYYSFRLNNEKMF